MSHLTYPYRTYHRIPIERLVMRHNRQRHRWPMIILAFLLGLLAGWVLRDGGAWLP